MRKSLLSLLFAILCLSTFAQTKEFSKINQAFLKNSGIIESKEGQSGYYFFYQYDKVAKGKYTYILELVDANYKPIRKINIQRPKYDLLLECAYNGSNFFITFVTKKYEMEVLSYSNEGKKNR